MRSRETTKACWRRESLEMMFCVNLCPRYTMGEGHISVKSIETVKAEVGMERIRIFSQLCVGSEEFHFSSCYVCYVYSAFRNFGKAFSARASFPRKGQNEQIVRRPCADHRDYNSHALYESFGRYLHITLSPRSIYFSSSLLISFRPLVGKLLELLRFRLYRFG